jgi:hypothetical protein
MGSSTHPGRPYRAATDRVQVWALGAEDRIPMRPALVRPADPDFGQAVSSRRSRGVHRSRRLRQALPVDALAHQNVFRRAETYIRIDAAYFSEKAALAQPPSWGLLCMDAPPPCIQHAGSHRSRLGSKHAILPAQAQ